MFSIADPTNKLKIDKVIIGQKALSCLQTISQSIDYDEVICDATVPESKVGFVRKELGNPKKLFSIMQSGALTISI